MKYYCRICGEFSVEEITVAKFATIETRLVCRKCGRTYPSVEPKIPTSEDTTTEKQDLHSEDE